MSPGARGRGDECRRRPSARAEQTDAEHPLTESFGDEISDRDEPLGEQVDLETEAAGALVLLLLDRREEVEQQRGQSSVLQCPCQPAVARTESTAPTAVREQDDAAGVVRNSEIGFDRAAGDRKPHVARSHRRLRCGSHGNPQRAVGKVSGISPRAHTAVRSSGSTARVTS
jgi:hypothetical protein